MHELLLRGAWGTFMNTSLLRFLILFLFSLAITGCESLQESVASTDSENTESSEDASEEGQGGADGSNAAAPVDQGSDDGDTATGDANGEAGSDSGEGSGSDNSEPDWGDEDGDWGEDEDDWDDPEDPWDDEMDGPGSGPGDECFHACEMGLHENLYACDPDGEWEGDGGGMPPPPPEEPQADPEEPEESENEPTDPSDGWGGDDECTEQAFEEFHGCIEQCHEDQGWDGPHDGPLACPERCDYFAEDVMGMCMENVGNEEECAELSEHAHMICIDECDEHDGPGGPGGPGDGPDHDHDHDHDGNDDDDMMTGVFECGNQICAMWEEYCETVYPGQPQGQISHQCLPLPDQCEPEEGYCSCIEVVAAGAGVCEEDDGIVYVTVYAP